MPGPLAGVLVVAVEQAVAGPMASCRLADAGARVIKIERPEGDFGRTYDRKAKWAPDEIGAKVMQLVAQAPAPQKVYGT